MKSLYLAAVATLLLEIVWHLVPANTAAALHHMIIDYIVQREKENLHTPTHMYICYINISTTNTRQTK